MQGNIPDYEKMALALHPYDKVRDNLLTQEVITWKMMSQNKLLMEKYEIQTEYLLVHNHENDTIDTVKDRINALNKLRGIGANGSDAAKKYRDQLEKKQFSSATYNLLQNQNVNSLN
jgi:ABC-type hemin transport system substrate-binding protein